MAKEGKTPKKDKGGRPRQEIDFEILQGCCQVGCTAEECAGILNVSVSTLDKRIKDNGYDGFKEYHKIHFNPVKQSLRRAQIKSALNGNTTMMIWLGKQFLSQRDKADLDVQSGIKIMWDSDIEGL